MNALIVSTYNAFNDSVIATVSANNETATVTMSFSQITVEESRPDFIIENFKVLNHAHFAAKVIDFLLENADEQDADIAMLIAKPVKFSI